MTAGVFFFLFLLYFMELCVIYYGLFSSFSQVGIRVGPALSTSAIVNMLA